MKKCRFDLLLFCTMLIYTVILGILLFGKANGIRSWNWIPFRFVRDYILGNGVLAVSNIIGNILLFVPVGAFAVVLNRNKGVCINTAWTVLFSVCMEGLQFVLAVGVTDIDDILLNGIGGLIGVVFAHAAYRLLGQKAAKVVETILMIAAVVLIALLLCLHYGVFGIRIRLL